MGFRRFDPKWGAVATRPKDALSCAKTRHMTYISLKLDHRYGLDIYFKRLRRYGDL